MTVYKELQYKLDCESYLTVCISWRDAFDKNNTSFFSYRKFLFCQEFRQNASFLLFVSFQVLLDFEHNLDDSFIILSDLQ